MFGVLYGKRFGLEMFWAIRRGITQKKAYNIQYTAKVWNKKSIDALYRQYQ